MPDTVTRNINLNKQFQTNVPPVSVLGKRTRRRQVCCLTSDPCKHAAVPGAHSRWEKSGVCEPRKLIHRHKARQCPGCTSLSRRHGPGWTGHSVDTAKVTSLQEGSVHRPPPGPAVTMGLLSGQDWLRREAQVLGVAHPACRLSSFPPGPAGPAVQRPTRADG